MNSRWCWCCWFRGHTLRITSLDHCHNSKSLLVPSIHGNSLVINQPESFPSPQRLVVHSDNILLLNRYLHYQLHLAAALKEDSIFVPGTQRGLWKLRPDLLFVFFSSHTPCKYISVLELLLHCLLPCVLLSVDTFLEKLFWLQCSYKQGTEQATVPDHFSTKERLWFSVPNQDWETSSWNPIRSETSHRAEKSKAPSSVVIYPESHSVHASFNSCFPLLVRHSMTYWICNSE